MLHFCAIFVVFPILFYVLSYVFTLFVQMRWGKCCSGAKNFLSGMRCRKYLIFHGIYPIRNQIFPRAFFYTVIDTGRNLPEHPKQISRLQSRPSAFVRMCLKAALTAKRLICKKTLAGCDRSVCQPVYPEDTFGGCFRVRFLQFLGFCRKRTRSEGQIVSCSELEIF